MQWLHNLYGWTIRQSESKTAVRTMCGVSFAESSFFPIPPDVMLLPMMLAKPERAWHLAFLCTLSSVLGGIVGYGIGYFLFDTVGQWIMDTYNMHAAFQRFHDEFATWGLWIILAKGLTPIPFKLVTIASGVANFPIIPFILASFVTRGMRFFLIAALLKRYGEPMRAFIEKYLVWVTFGFLLIVALGFWLVIRFA